MEAGAKIATFLALSSFLLVAPATGIECVQCVSEASIDCVTAPPPAKPCPQPSKFCITVRETFAENGTLSMVTRTCSPIDLGLKCQENQSPLGGSLKVCHVVCSEDNCNNIPMINSGNQFFLGNVVLILFALIHHWLA